MLDSFTIYKSNQEESSQGTPSAYGIIHGRTCQKWYEIVGYKHKEVAENSFANCKLLQNEEILKIVNLIRKEDETFGISSNI